MLEQVVPQSLILSDALDVPHDVYAVEAPRRSSKTTSLFAKLLGRCALRPGYRVTFSAQNGIASSRRFREWAQALDRVNPPGFDELAPPWMRNRPTAAQRQAQRQASLFDLDVDADEVAEQQHSRPFRILRGAGNQRIDFHNGSAFIVFPPDPAAFRGEAADVSWFDEAQEIDPLVADDLEAAVLPMQDTRPGASTLWSGTAGEARVGPFWRELELMRRGVDGHGGVDWTIGDYSVEGVEAVDWEELEDEGRAMVLLEQQHPGVGTLTDLDTMRKRYRRLPRPQWAREYGSVWPVTAGSSAIPVDWWSRAELATMKRRPKRVAFAWDIKPGGGSSAIVAAWRDAAGVAYVELVAHRQGTAYLPERAQQLSAGYPGTLIGFDDIGEGKATALECERLRPKPRLKSQPYREHAAACVAFLRELERGRLKHFGQAGLDAAARAAAKRTVRNEAGVWLWTVGAEGGDVTPIVAATRALGIFDRYLANRSEEPRGVIIAS